MSYNFNKLFNKSKVVTLAHSSEHVVYPSSSPWVIMGSCLCLAILVQVLVTAFASLTQGNPKIHFLFIHAWI